MVVRITTVLENKLKSGGLDSRLFVKSFKDWKSGEEHESFYFGKDGKYFTPSVGGVPYVLRHVHLVPIIERSTLNLWKKSWRHRSRKTSDRVLVYVQDNQGGYLLITILPEPGSHQIARMETPQDRDLMERFALIAEAFINDGEVIA
jgi:mRNA interferase YafO